jgi:hypothetical protein
MSIFAGIFARHAVAHVSDQACDAIRRSLVRSGPDEVTEFRDRRVFVAKLDFNAFGAPGFNRHADGSVSLVAGEPLLATLDVRAAPTRTADLEALHLQWDREDWSGLQAARGTFCAAHYTPKGDGRLTLIADKLGIRALYYWIGEEYVLFATALRILEALPQLPKRMDVRGVTEAACFGYPLADRTPYDGVRLLRPAELVTISRTSVARTQYWRWDEIPPTTRPERELLQLAYDRFTAGVAHRLRGDSATLAFLSGGLDSRCLVASLRQLGTRVYTFNFALPGTQDQVLGTAFARAVGTDHQTAPMPVELETHWSSLLASAWGGVRERTGAWAERPHLAWSGDGGSFGLGHIYLTSPVIDLMRARRIDTAIELFLDGQRTRVARRVLQPSVRDALAAIPSHGIRGELDDIRSEDAGRAFYLFLLFNGQRRLLARHFEDLDLHRLEFQLPFFDSDFLAAVVQAPIDSCLQHGFYHRWLELLPPVVTSVPWQTYPGHLPCPLPIPADLRYQWSSATPPEYARPLRRELLRRARAILAGADFPHALVNKGAFRVATWLHRARVRDYGYAIRQVSQYQTYWARCGGQWMAPELPVGEPAPQPPTRRPQPQVVSS